MPMTGTHRVAIDAFCRNLVAASSLDGVIKPDDDFAGRSEGRNQQAQENLRGGDRRPMSPIKKVMIVLKVRFLGFAADAQTSRDGALANGKNRADEQDFGVFEDSFGEQRRESYNQR